MNTYRTKFFAVCPNNGVRVEYALEIWTETRIMAEDLIDAVTLLQRGFHEDLADQLHREFGGVQRLIADHHGVQIETVRSATECHPAFVLDSGAFRTWKLGRRDEDPTETARRDHV